MPALASPAAYEQPTLNRAWEAFLAHIPTILLIWIATVAISAAGFACYLVITLAGIAVAGGGQASEFATTLAATLGQLGQLPFAILSSLVGVLLVAVPALHYETGETITVEAAFRTLFQRPWRYLLAGILFALATAIGLAFCILPGLAVALVGPVYVNKVFNSEVPVVDAFAASFQAVYRSPKGLEFVGIQILAVLVVLVVAVCTCGLGALLAVPVSTFYIQNTAYHLGVVS